MCVCVCGGIKQQQHQPKPNRNTNTKTKQKQTNQKPSKTNKQLNTNSDTDKLPEWKLGPVVSLSVGMHVASTLRRYNCQPRWTFLRRFYLAGAVYSKLTQRTRLLRTAPVDALKRFTLLDLASPAGTSMQGAKLFR